MLCLHIASIGSMKHLFALLFLGLVNLGPAPAMAAELIMVEEQGCYWCGRWNEEIAPIYPKTTEGKYSPLRRIDIHDPLPTDINFLASLYFTPTFVLIENGQEIGRIEGYPGEDFFWGLLGRMLTEHTSYCGGSTEC